MSYRSLISVVTLVSIVAAAHGQAVPYKNAEKGFTILRPQDWTESTPANTQVVVAFSSPQAPNDTFIENLNVVVEAVPAAMANVDANAVTDQSKAAMYQQLQAKEVSDEKTTVGGAAARKLTYDANIQGQTIRQILWVVVNDKKIYYLTFSAAPDAPDTMRQFAEAMAGSMKFTGGNAAPPPAPPAPAPAKPPVWN